MLCHLTLTTPKVWLVKKALGRHHKEAHNSEESDTSEFLQAIAAEWFILSSDRVVLSDKNVKSETDLVEIDKTENKPIATEQNKNLTEETVNEN